MNKIREALKIADEFCGNHTAAECPDSVAIPIKEALKELDRMEAEKPDGINRYDCDINYGMIENNQSGDYIRFEDAQKFAERYHQSRMGEKKEELVCRWIELGNGYACECGVFVKCNNVSGNCTCGKPIKVITSTQ